MTAKAIYEKGVFRPTEPVDLPEKAEVEVLVSPAPPIDPKLEAVYRVLSERYHSGRRDIAERHNEHQP